MVSEGGDLRSWGEYDTKEKRARSLPGAESFCVCSTHGNTHSLRGDLSPFSPLLPAITLPLVSLAMKNIISGQNST